MTKQVMYVASTNFNLQRNDLVCFKDLDAFNLTQTYLDLMIKKEVSTIVLTKSIDSSDSKDLLYRLLVGMDFEMVNCQDMIVKQGPKSD